MNSTEWIVVMMKIPADTAMEQLVKFYRYAGDLIGVQDVHFVIRDRVEDDVVFSYRLLIDSPERGDLEERIAFELGGQLPQEAFAINPEPDHPLHTYTAWPWTERMDQTGSDKFTLFCRLLSGLSKTVVEMAEHEYFESNERVEVAHIASWMLGCTEYGLLSTDGMQVGYYDRIADQYHPYLQYAFQRDGQRDGS